MHPRFTPASVLRSAALLAALAATISSSAQSTHAASTEAPSVAPSVVAVFDCNENGIEDAVDIAVGSSSDANANGLPDECEGRVAD